MSEMKRTKFRDGSVMDRRVRYGIATLLGFVTLLAFYLYTGLDGAPEALAAAASQEAKSGVATSVIAYPLTTFADGKARQFQYKMSDGTAIRYFILKSSDGVIRAAFDACDVCWPENKGYYQDGDFMVCKNCGRRFQSAKMNVVTGGCNPSALQRTIQDDKVVIQVKHIEEGKRFFPRTRG